MKAINQDLNGMWKAIRMTIHNKEKKHWHPNYSASTVYTHQLPEDPMT